MIRARETAALLDLPKDIPVEVTPLLTEFNYGDYEGMKTSEIKALTNNPGWETWVDPAPNAETPTQVQDRIDHLIRYVRDQHHKPAFKDPALKRKNVLLVARKCRCYPS